MAKRGVSFVIPVYNKAKYIGPVLKQVARQKGDFEKQYIIVDDGSTDDSLKIIHEITSDWSDVTIVRQENKGAANATNAGIARVSQPYIKFVDADDLLTDTATDTLLSALENSTACLSFGEAIWYREDSSINFSISHLSPKIELLDNPLRLAMRNTMFNPTQCLAKSEAVDAVGGCDERTIHTQDYSLTLRLALHWPLLRIHMPVAYIPESVAQRVSADQAYVLRRVTRTLALFVRDHPELDKNIKQYACRRAASRAWRYSRRNKGVLRFIVLVDTIHD